MAFYPGENYVNAPLRLTATFQDDSGAAVDPDTVVIRTYSPSGVATTYTLGEDDEVQMLEAGYYSADITHDEAGRWHFRWQSTGTGETAVQEGDFLVQASAFYDDTSDAYGWR